MRKSLILMLLAVALVGGLLWGQGTSDDDLEALELFEALGTSESQGEEAQREDMALIESLEQKSPPQKSEDVFDAFDVLPDDKQEETTEEGDVFSQFSLPEDEAEEENAESDVFAEFALPGEEVPEVDKSTGKKTTSSVTFSDPEIDQDFSEMVEEFGEEVLEYFNPFYMYYKTKKVFRGKKTKIIRRRVAPQGSESKNTETAEVVEPPEEEQPKKISQIEKEILEQKEMDIGFLDDLDNLEVTDLSGPEIPDLSETEKTETPTETAKVSPEVPATKPDDTEATDLLTENTEFLEQTGVDESQKVEFVEEVVEVEDEEEEDIPPSFIKGTYSFDYALLTLPNSYFNPHNVLDLPHSLHRHSLRFILDYDMYSDPESLLFVKLYAKDTYVYSQPSTPEHAHNYLQELYLSLMYQQFSMAAGKMNVQSGDGGLAYNPTDYFAFPSNISHPKDNNSERRGAREGFFAVQGSYSLPMCSLTFLYSPDLTDDGDVRENSEFKNNKENVYYGKFTWILFDPTNEYSLIGSLGDELSPASPEFFFSYFDRRKIFNAGMNWSVGVGDMTILKLEVNYSDKTTNMIEWEELPPLGPFPQYGIGDRKGHNWQMIFGITYTPSNFNINMQYFFNYNGFDAGELDEFFDIAKFLNDNHELPLIGELYLGLLQQAAGKFDPSYSNQHYFITSIDYSFYIGDKKRPLIPEFFGVITPEDWSGAVGGRIRYEVLNYLKVYLNYSTTFGKKDSAFGAVPLRSSFTVAADINF